MNTVPGIFTTVRTFLNNAVFSFRDKSCQLDLNCCMRPLKGLYHNILTSF